MSQIPTSGNTYSRLSILKAKAVLEKNGSSSTWDALVSAMIDVCNKHPESFSEAIKMSKSKTRTVEELNDEIKSGNKVTSEDIKQTPGRIKE